MNHPIRSVSSLAPTVHVLCLAMAQVLVLTAIGYAQAEAGRRPNIVLIVADDWGWGDLSCRGHQYVKTPHLDHLATTGTQFYQFTVASGVCSPSRTALMTGLYPARFAIHGHFASVQSHIERNMPDWLDPTAVTLPRLLQNAGYATAHFGKWHLTNTMVPDAPLPLEYGYETYGAFNCSGPQMPVHDDVRRTIEFVESSVEQQRPFFVNLWIHEPHTPHYPLPEFLESFSNLDNEADRIYAAVLAHADSRIGQLVAALERLGVRDETLIIFTSDNGPENTGAAGRRQMDDESTGPGFSSFASVGTTGGHRGRKRSLLQGGIGVPFIASWPGRIPPGQIDDITPLTAVDLLPTLCAVSGVAYSADFLPDGEDLSTALQGKPQAFRNKPIFWQWQSASASGDTWPAHAVRADELKLLMGKTTDRIELFRMTADRLEKHNLLPRESGQAARLKSLLEEWQQSLPRSPSPACYSESRKIIDNNSQVSPRE